MFFIKRVEMDKEEIFLVCLVLVGNAANIMGILMSNLLLVVLGLACYATVVGVLNKGYKKEEDG